MCRCHVGVSVYLPPPLGSAVSAVPAVWAVCVRLLRAAGARGGGQSRSSASCAPPRSRFSAVPCGLLSAVRPRARHRPRGSRPRRCLVLCYRRGYPRLTVDKSAGLTHAAALDNSLRSPAHIHTYTKKRFNTAWDLKSRGERSPYRFDPGHRHQRQPTSKGFLLQFGCMSVSFKGAGVPQNHGTSALSYSPACSGLVELSRGGNRLVAHARKAAGDYVQSLRQLVTAGVYVPHTIAHMYTKTSIQPLFFVSRLEHHG